MLKYFIDKQNREGGEDSFFINTDKVGVVDGVTTLKCINYKDYYSQADWLADNLGKYLSDTEGQIPTLSQQFVNNTKAEIYKEMPKLLRPSCCVAGIEYGNPLTIRVIGDCLVSLLTDYGIFTYTDTRVNVFAEVTKQKRLSGASTEEIELSRKHQREMINVKDGYWVVAYNNEFKNEFLTFSFPTNDIKKCLIYTDGFERIFRLTNISIMDIFNEKYSLQEAVRILREQERIALAERKRHDDATAILINMKGEK